jgi:membrane protease YdiL (CAAX protease family)
VSFVADPVVIGFGFAGALAAVAVAGGLPFAPRRVRSLPIGFVGGAVLVGMAVLARLEVGWPPSAMPVALIPWAVATIMVATAEEAVLRGALFDALAEQAGQVNAVLVTSVAFALMHVPLYGWQVVPLDLGVGLWLAGLRLLSGGIVAPALAHALADLATRWL